MGLSNPYSHPPRPSRGERLRRAVTVGGAAVGIAVVAGCGADPPPPAPDPVALPGTATPPTMPLPTPPPPAPPLDGPAPAPPPAASSAPTTPDRAGVAGERPIGPPQLANDGADHRVVRGDTLSGIAARFDVDGGWPRIWARNCDVLYDPDFILPGQELDLDGPVVPGCGS